MLLSVRWVTWPIVIQGENKIWGLRQGFPYTLASPSFPLPTLSPCPTSRKLGQLVIHLISLTVACWLCHQAVHLLEQSLFFIILVKRKQKYYALFFLRFIMFCVCVCVCMSPKSGETIRRQPDFFNEPRGNAKFMCFHLQLGEAWYTNRKGGGRKGLFVILLKQVPWLLLGILTHLFIF